MFLSCREVRSDLSSHFAGIFIVFLYRTTLIKVSEMTHQYVAFANVISRLLISIAQCTKFEVSRPFEQMYPEQEFKALDLNVQETRTRLPNNTSKDHNLESLMAPFLKNILRDKNRNSFQ